MSTAFTYHTTQNSNIIATLVHAAKRVGAWLNQSSDRRERAYEEVRKIVREELATKPDDAKEAAQSGL